jgi:hypothetical protein
MGPPVLGAGVNSGQASRVQPFGDQSYQPVPAILKNRSVQKRKFHGRGTPTRTGWGPGFSTRKSLRYCQQKLL